MLSSDFSAQHSPIQLSNEDLRSKIQALANEERQITLRLVRYLREFDHRKLWAELGYSSLFDYAVRELRFSEGAAYRRIQAMRLVAENPEAERKIEDGLLSLSNIASFQRFLSQERKQKNRIYTPLERRAVLAQLEGKSHRDGVRYLRTISPEAIPFESERPLSATETLIQFSATTELMQNLSELRNLLAHRDPSLSYCGLFTILSDIALEKLRPRPLKSDAISQTPQSISSNPRYIPLLVKRQVWERDGGQCAYFSDRNGQRCSSRHALEYDHIKPVAQGGQSTFENLRLLCRAHNQWKGDRLPAA